MLVDPALSAAAGVVGSRRRVLSVVATAAVAVSHKSRSNVYSTRVVVRGGYGRGSGVPLRDRIRPEQQVPAPSAPGASLCPARHCWVLAPADGTEPRPGLLVEWRRPEGPAGWSGRVFYLARVRGGRWSVVEEWIPAELLRGP